MSAFVTDASYKHTLAIVRSLGSRGIEVDVGASSPSLQLSSFSKYCRGSFIYPDPKRDLDAFVHFFRKICNHYDIIIPVGYVTTFFLSMKKDSINCNSKIPVADFPSLKVAASKKDSILLAKELGVPAPITFFPSNSSELMNLKIESYPVVVKAVYEGGLVRYAYNKRDLKEKFEEVYKLQGIPPLVQEFIKGVGYGFFALFNQGKPRAIFMHKRIRERYVIGGPSTCAESVFVPELMNYGMRILKALNWHGVAMVEFRRDFSDGKFKLMEINPKFWGSLDLAIASGVDFPHLLYKMVTEGDVNPVFNYKVGLRFMWPFPDDLLRTLNKLTNVKNFLLDLFNPHIKKNIVLADLKPTLSLIWNGFSLIMSKKVPRLAFPRPTYTF